MLILARYPDWQQSQRIVALGIFSSFTSTIAAYEFIIKRFIHQDENDSDPGQNDIINGQNFQITGGQQGTIIQQDMREQTVEGHQFNIAGDAKGPIFINAAARPSPPLQKPPRSQHFTGREEELASLLKDLRPYRAVTICGPGGMGKTALTAEAIWQLAPGSDPPQRFPDGIIFHTFYHKPQ